MYITWRQDVLEMVKFTKRTHWATMSLLKDVEEKWAVAVENENTSNPTYTFKDGSYITYAEIMGVQQ